MWCRCKHQHVQPTGHTEEVKILSGENVALVSSLTVQNQLHNLEE